MGQVQYLDTWNTLRYSLSRIRGGEYPHNPRHCHIEPPVRMGNAGFSVDFPGTILFIKKELLWIPIFGWGLALNRPIAIDRSKKIRALDTLVKEGVIRLKEGRWLVIFPEGTRGNPGEMGKFQVGGAMIAAKSGYPVVPVAHNAGLFWPKNSFLKYPGTIDVVIGPVIVSNSKKARQINREVEEWIVSKQKVLAKKR